jgi:hypothetical protein
MAGRLVVWERGTKSEGTLTAKKRATRQNALQRAGATLGTMGARSRTKTWHGHGKAQAGDAKKLSRIKSPIGFAQLLHKFLLDLTHCTLFAPKHLANK